MSWSQSLVLLAILIVFLFWRRARNQVTRLRAEIEEHRALNTFMFEAAPLGERRLVVRDASGSEVAPGTLSWAEHGLEVFAASPAPGAAPDPGERVELVEEDDGLAVWNRDMTGRLGTVGAGAAAVVRRRLDEGEVNACIVLETSAASADGSLTLLLIHAGVDVELDG